MLKGDCAHFKGDRPCKPNKENGIKCDNCHQYQPISFKILIIKLDAVGDVLRTTSILKPLKKKYPYSYIEWCTRKNSLELFDHNPFVDEVITIEDDALFRISAEEFNIVINLDTSKLSSSIASIANAKQKFGFILNSKGYVEATNEAAQQWLEMSAFDDVKKLNKKTYQQIMYEILELNLPVELPVIVLSEKEREKILSKNFLSKFNSAKPTIGLNLGVGTKWPSKGWSLKRWKELIEILGDNRYNLILLGGPEETEIISQLVKDYKFLINSGCHNSLLEFTAIVDLCDVVITADTLALHIATAIQKKIIALFGPTSSNEIELYGKGIKLSSTDECKCYYKKYCSEVVSCMEKITPQMVVNVISHLLDE